MNLVKHQFCKRSTLSDFVFALQLQERKIVINLVVNGETTLKGQIICSCRKTIVVVKSKCHLVILC